MMIAKIASLNSMARIGIGEDACPIDRLGHVNIRSQTLEAI
jgi:hypothetical protein